jgi:hypothetical protein
VRELLEGDRAVLVVGVLGQLAATSAVVLPAFISPIAAYIDS